LEQPANLLFLSLRIFDRSKTLISIHIMTKGIGEQARFFETANQTIK